MSKTKQVWICDENPYILYRVCEKSKLPSPYSGWIPAKVDKFEFHQIDLRIKQKERIKAAFSDQKMVFGIDTDAFVVRL